MTVKGEKRMLIGKRRVPAKADKVLVLVFGWVLHFIITGFAYGLPVLYPEFIAKYSTQATFAASIQGLFFGLATGGGFLFTSRIQQYGPSYLPFVGLVLCAIGFLASGFATDIWIVVICSGLIAGLGMCTSYLCAFIAVSWMYHPDPAVALVVLTTGGSAGQCLMPVVIEYLVTKYAVPNCLIIFSAITVQCIPFGLLMRMPVTDDVIESMNDDANKPTSRSSYMKLLTDVLVVIVLINCFLIALTGSVESWFIVDVMMNRGFTRETGSTLVIIIGLANFAGRTLGSIIRFKLNGIPTASHWIYSCSIMTLAHLFMVNQRSYSVIVAAVTIQGVVNGMSIAYGPAIIYEATGAGLYPYAMSTVNIVYGLADILTNVLGGVVRDVFGGYDVIWYVSAAAAVYMTCGTIAAVYIIRLRTLRDLPKG